MSSNQLIINCIQQLWKAHFKLYSFTLLTGFAWRFFLIASYVFSVSAIGMVFGDNTNAFDMEQYPIVNTAYFIPLLVFLFFLLTAVTDIVFTVLKGRLSSRILDDINNLLAKDQTPRVEIKAGREYYSSQILMKCFELSYAVALFVGILAVLTAISVGLVLGLLALVSIAAIALYFMKKQMKLSFDSGATLGNKAEVGYRKLLRSSLFRSISMLTAGLFLSLLVWALSSGYLNDVSVIEVALIAFCIRFVISFFIIILTNMSALLDAKLLLSEYDQMLCFSQESPDKL